MADDSTTDQPSTGERKEANHNHGPKTKGKDPKRKTKPCAAQLAVDISSELYPDD